MNSSTRASSATPKLTEQDLYRLLALQEQREADRREIVRQAVVSSEVPLPSNLVETIILLNNTYARAILRDHKGFQLAERRNSYLTSLTILENCLQDLLSAIYAFEKEAVAENADLFHRSRKEEISRIQRQVQKELFATANAAAALVDHARRVMKCQWLPEYDAKRVEYFGTDGLHDFVIALRVMLQHLHIVGAGYLTTHDFRTDTKTATFTISKETILRVIASAPGRFGRKSDASMLAFVQASAEAIDLRELFDEYRVRTSRFRAWMKNALASEKLTALRDYDRIIQERRTPIVVNFGKP